MGLCDQRLPKHGIGARRGSKSKGIGVHERGDAQCQTEVDPLRNGSETTSADSRYAHRGAGERSDAERRNEGFPSMRVKRAAERENVPTQSVGTRAFLRCASSAPRSGRTFRRRASERGLSFDARQARRGAGERSDAERRNEGFPSMRVKRAVERENVPTQSVGTRAFLRCASSAPRSGRTFRRRASERGLSFVVG